ncbi:zonadhesin [Rhineura floridana]|uniref:zonadhesin n=1 Tax=Rhineura floridana TaxID=261503 RepID=UPI002AC869CF|nr:zonadhesin [Rhineura floridana]
MESTAGKPTATSQGSSRTTRHVVPDISSSPGPANITQSGRTTTLTTPAGSATTTRRGSSTTTDQATTSQKKPATTSSTRTTGHGTAAAISTTSNSNIKTSTISTAASHSPTGGLPSTTTGHASHATATISHTSGSSANATTAGCTSPTMSTSTTRQVSSPRTSSSPTSPPHVSPTTDHPIVTQYTTSQAGPVTTSPTATSWPRTTGYEKPSTTSHTTSSQPRTTGHEKPSTVSHTTSSQPRTTGHEKPSTARYTTSSQPRTTGHEKPSTVSHTTSSQPRTTGHEKPSTASHTTSSQPRTTGHEKPSTARHTTSSQPRTTGHEKPSTARHTTSSQPRTTGHEKPSTVSHTTSSQPRTTGHEKPSTARHTTSSQPRTTGHEKPSTTSPTATSWPRTTGHKEPSTTSHATSSWASPNSTVGHSEPSTTKSILTSTTISSISQSSSATASHGSPATKHTTPTHHVNGTTTSQGSSTASHVSPRTTRLPPATSGSPTTMSPASPVTSHSNATATAAVATSMSHASTMATTRPSSATTWHVRESTATHATSHTAITAGQTTITSTKISSTSTPTGSVATATTSAPSTTVAKLTSTPGVSTRTTATTETPVPSPDREICTISGDPHYTTYDGRLFHFMGTCTYLLSALCNATSGLPTFRIVATNEHRGGNKQVSYVKSVSVEVYGIQIVLLKGRRVTVDGQRVTLPVFLAGRQVSVRLSGTFALVQTDFGLWVRFDGNHHMEVSAPATYMGQLCGLCGNYNGQTSDDNLMPNGTSAGENAEKLGESWQIPDAGDTGCTNSGGPGQCDKDIAADALKPTSCGILTDPQGPFAPCHSKVPPEGAFVNCVYDLCGTDGDAGSLCFALQSYADRCAQAGITITWRNNSFCPLNCPPGTSYTSCGPVCPATCRDPAFNTSCPNLLCVEGCVCDKGYILSGDQCVPLDQCGCTDPSGQYHPVGESWMGNSNCTQRCTCAPFDNITCEEWNCSPVQECRPLEGLLGCQDTGVAACHVAGDPHYYTFDGTMVSFMGTCTYILVTLCHSDPRLPSFNITAKNEERGQPEASYLRHVTVEVAGVTITLQKSRRVLIDGQRVRTPVEGLIPGVSVTTSGIYVVLETNFGLVVKFDGNHHLEIQLPGTYFDKVCGMCGNFNNQSRDDLLMANRQLAANASQFGNSWKAPGDADPGCQPDNREDLEPRCSAQEMQHLQALCREILEPKYQPCHGIIDPQPFIQNCLYDMCEYQGMASVLCDNIQSYVEACKSQGAVGLSWRNITFCPLPCPLHSHYTNCSSPCPATCANLYAPASCQRPTACAEGCACDRGYILSDDTCVSMRDCGCLDNRHEYYNPGDTWVNANCLQRCTCIGNGEITCQPFQCVPGSHCALSTSGLRYCRPTKFHQCVISGDPHYRTFDNFVHHFQGRATYVLTRTLDDLPRALEPFSISGRNRRRFPLHRFSFLREVYVSVYGYSITLMEGRKMAINGVKVTPPYYPRDGLQITQRGRTLFVQTDFGISVSFDGRDFAEIVLPSTYQNHVGGLCGNYDGWPNNEYMKLDKTWTHNLNAFGNSWQVSVQRAVLGREREAASHPRIRREEPLDEAETGFQIDCTPEELIVVNGTRVCGALSDPQGPFAACHGVLSPSNFQESCVYDLCALYDDKELLCEDYEAYALLCQEEGVTLGPWRQKMGCEISCPLHTTYKSCMTACPASCANMAAPSDCDAPCVEGCASDPGHILSGLDSVPYNQCGCTSNGQYYEINDSFFMEDCSQQCTCRNTGTLECVAVGCPGGQICAVANFTRGCFKETPCLSNPCQNEGVCEDTTDSFICVCPEGYAGRLCEEMPLDVVSAENTLTAILIGVLVPLGLILIAVTAVCIYRRRSKKKLREEHIPVLSNPGRGKASAMTGDRITRL